MASGCTSPGTSFPRVITPEIVGYQLCRCNAYVLELTFMQLGHQCWDCYSKSDLRKRRIIEVSNRGASATLKLPPRKRTGSRGSKGNHTTRTIRKHAERAALLRLKRMFPDAYDLLYTEERLRRGLPVVPKPGTTTSAPGTAYAAATNGGSSGSAST